MGCSDGRERERVRVDDEAKLEDGGQKIEFAEGKLALRIPRGSSRLEKVKRSRTRQSREIVMDSALPNLFSQALISNSLLEGEGRQRYSMAKYFSSIFSSCIFRVLGVIHSPYPLFPLPSRKSASSSDSETFLKSQLPGSNRNGNDKGILHIEKNSRL